MIAEKLIVFPVFSMKVNLNKKPAYCTSITFHFLPWTSILEFWSLNQ